MQENSNIQDIIVEAISNKKGKKTVIIDLSEIDGASTGKIIICQGNNTTQVAAIADSVRDTLLEKCSLKPINYEGYRNSQWIIVDYGDIMLHVFLPEYRNFYNLEDLWNDAPMQVVPDED